jgi:DNA-3-methyladenine glycosylase I
MSDASENRCPWANGPGDALMATYHDSEWGVPNHDDRHHFEFLVLESAQSGLSWRTVLNKRDGYRRLFAHFDPELVATFGPLDVERLMADPAIIRNRAKIESAIANARVFLSIQSSEGSFASYLWSFADGVPIRNHWSSEDQIPATSELSVRVAKEFKARGFRFLGPITCYSHLQAVGIVNDHLVTCPRWKDPGS